MAKVEPLYLTESEIAERIGVSRRSWQAIAKRLEREGFPRRDPSVGRRRYWPACKAFLDRRHNQSAASARGLVGDPKAMEKWT